MNLGNQGKYANFDTYITENHHKREKSLFVRVADLLEAKRGQLPGNARILDVGCATGALVEYLKGRFPEWSFTGIDISAELITLAQERVSNCEFLVGSATQLPDLVHGKFDVILCFGVLGVFDEEGARRVLNDSIHLLNSNGVGYFVAQFNDYDVDVSIKHRKYVDEKLRDWEGGWSIYSQRTIREWIGTRARALNFIDFEPDFQLQPKSDPVRTWTIELEGKRQLTNGLNLLVNLRYLEILT